MGAPNEFEGGDGGAATSGKHGGGKGKVPPSGKHPAHTKGKPLEVGSEKGVPKGKAKSSEFKGKCFDKGFVKGKTKSSEFKGSGKGNGDGNGGKNQGTKGVGKGKAPTKSAEPMDSKSLSTPPIES